MTLHGKRQLDARLKALGDTRPLMQSIQLAVISEAKRLVPRKTGHLGRSILPGPVSRDNAIIEVRTPYAAAVEFGSRPHVIRPRRARMLAWPAAGGAKLSGRARAGADMIFARRVNHPGTKAQPYLVPAVRHAVGSFRDEIIKRWNDAA